MSVVLMGIDVDRAEFNLCHYQLMTNNMLTTTKNSLANL